VEAENSVTKPRDTDQDPARASRLDGGTQLVSANWYPTAGEAIAYVGTAPRARQEADEDEAAAIHREELSPPDRAAENLARAGRRARSRVRRYVSANGCTRMVSLTFAPTGPVRSAALSATGARPAGAGASPADCGRPEVPPSSAEVVHQEAGESGQCGGCGRPFGTRGLLVAMRDGARWVRRLREALGVERLPYVLVPEFHRDGHVHLHALLDRFVPEPVLAATWGRGYVDVRRFRGSGGREAARKAAAYASKYVGKTFAAAGGGRHRYEVGEGFQPAVVKRSGFRSLEDAVSWVCDDYVQVVAFAVHSDALDDYEGPPFLWVALDDG
jgi:hypothetical protein